MDSNSRKRLRRSKEGEDTEVQEQQQQGTAVDDRLFETAFPKHLEAKFATAIFEIGLKHSSPKILMPLMPTYTNLSTEHIKSHLQKYRIHRQRSKDEFMEFYNAYMKESYQKWEDNKGWKPLASDNSLQGYYYSASVDSNSSSRENSSGNFQAPYDVAQYANFQYAPPYQEHGQSGDHNTMAQYLPRVHTGEQIRVSDPRDQAHYPLSGNSSSGVRAIAAAAREEATSAYAAQIYRETEALLQSALELSQEAAVGSVGERRKES